MTAPNERNAPLAAAIGFNTCKQSRSSSIIENADIYFAKLIAKAIYFAKLIAKAKVFSMSGKRLCSGTT
jgi:hypothetical protein